MIDRERETIVEPSKSRVDCGSDAGAETAQIPSRIGRYRIVYPLGSGAFGIVYLAYDDELNRPVAIKIPHRHRLEDPQFAEMYVSEARILASLDHPNIVPVYDVGRGDDGSCFVVSKFIEGSTLGKRLKDVRIPIQEAAELAATIASALHHAHQRGLVHRDVKPDNILLEADGKPYLADFGLALREEDFGKGMVQAGTPVYMSPEQIRGQSHRVDGRSDVFSLGVVLYEALVGKPPFSGKSRSELCEQIVNVEARPPRQVLDAIPKELERICLKALSKRSTERYTTAKDLADDLLYFLHHYAEPAKESIVDSNMRAITTVSAVAPASGTASDQRSIQIVPKGLRSFDAGDADFFLDLLPGPRDREGLPESIRFWKARIESRDHDSSFAIGLLYGPSGCGKSSLVSAGLLPRLAPHVFRLRVEATADGTETRLLRGLQKLFPGLHPGAGLAEVLGMLRRGKQMAHGQKLLMVLDQFEQWLHAHPRVTDSELMKALRQCDGERVQALVMVRDDFWLAVSRFMENLEVDLVQDCNMAMVDLFDDRHARKVLIAFGRAFGALPAHEKISRQQDAFIDKAIQGLSQSGRVVPVRLALFAEMVKNKPWEPTTWREVGGTEGVGVTFLEETFSASTAPLQNRLHQKASQAVLKALLPETAADIKGKMRTRDELLQTSGYEKRPRSFEQLLRILDSDLRLITPADSEGEVAARPESDGGLPSHQPYFQLSHDYLVPSLRVWLARKKKETRRGRAELRLDERAAAWSVKPEHRNLPAFWEWAVTELFTRKRDWSPAQQKMMRAATRSHCRRVAALLLVTSLIGYGVREGYGRIRAAGLRDRVLDATTSETKAIVAEMPPYRGWLDPLLYEAYADAERRGKSREQLNASLALLDTDARQVDYLYQRLLSAQPQEVSVLRQALLPHRNGLVQPLWEVAEQSEEGTGERLRAACALALFDRESSRWEKISQAVAADLVRSPAVYLLTWVDCLRPVRQKLTDPLITIYKDANQRELERSLATDILADYLGDQPELLADLLMDANEQQFAPLFDRLKDHAETATNLLVAEIDKQLPPQWNDLPLDPSWRRSDQALMKELETAQGFLSERYAFCQTMPLADFSRVAEALRAGGYRPIGFRPYAVTQTPAGTDSVLVAAVWTRDGREWEFAQGLTAAELQDRDRAGRGRMLQLADIASYVHNGQVYYAAIWVKIPPNSLVTEVAVGANEEEFEKRDAALIKQGFWRTRTALCQALDHSVRYTATWTKPPGRRPPGPYDSIDSSFIGGEIDYSRTNYPADVQVDVHLSSHLASSTVARRYSAIWHPLAGMTSTEVHGLDPAEHRRRCSELFDEGYRPVALSVADCRPDPALRHDQPGGRSENAGLIAASVWQRPIVPDEAKEQLAKRQANAIVALFRLGRTEKVWPYLQSGPDSRLRSYLIHRLGPLGSSHGELVTRLDKETDASSRAAILLCWGGFNKGQLSAGGGQDLIDKLERIHRLDPDAGVHSACEWLLRKLSRQSIVQQNEREFSTGKIEGSRRWFLNKQGNTFAIARAGEFLIGSPRTELSREGGVISRMECLHRRRIDHDFAIATHEVTVEEFLRFRPSHGYSAYYAPSKDCPVETVTWYDAVAYCNWLSEQEGMPREQWCYELNANNEYAEGLRVKPDFSKLRGYRLPTESEWEYAARAGTLTSRHYGETEELLGQYAWYTKNSHDRSMLPVGTLKPNDWGLFDIIGNAGDWTQDLPSDYVPSRVHLGAEEEQSLKSLRVARGCTYQGQPLMARSSNRGWLLPRMPVNGLGFRVAQSVPPQGE
jgi:serine/threonine protein kinase/formylglycine-generating enzyme required for sulfatase activity